MSLGRKILSGASASAMFTAVSVLVSVLQLRWVIHYLTKELAGVWILFLTMGAYITFFDLGLSPTLGREISFVIGRSSSPEFKAYRVKVLLKTCSKILAIISSIILVLATLCGKLVFDSHFQRTSAGSHLFLSWCIFCFGACINLLGSAAFAGLYGIGEIALEKLMRSISLLAGLGFYWLALWSGFGIPGLAIAWVIQGFLARGLAWLALRRKVSLQDMSAIRADWRTAREMAIPSLRFAAVQLGAILILQTANLVIAFRLGATSVPLYESVSKLATTLMTLSLLAVLSSSPFVSRAFAARDSSTVEYLLKNNLRFGMALLVFMTSFIAIFGQDVVRIWLGPGLFPGNPVLWTLLLMVILEVHHVIFASTMMATGEIVFVPPAIIAGVLSILLSFTLAGSLGLWGVALGVFIAQLTTNNWYAPWVTARFFSIKLSSLVPDVYVSLVVFSAIQLLADSLLHRLAHGTSLRLTALLGFWLVATCIGSLSFVYVICSKSERNQLLGFILRLNKVDSLNSV